MVNEVWQITSDSTEPVDGMLSGVSDSDEYLTLKELCDELSISTATGRNWIRLGKLTPEYIKKSSLFFKKICSKSAC